MKNAKIIVLESLDGGGKGTQSNLIKKYLEHHNLKYKYLHFPMYGNNEASNVVAAYLRGEYGNIDEVNPIFVANIYAMDRYLYLPELKKHIVENDVILLDRYVFSNMAYQGAKYTSDTQSEIIRDWISELEFGFLELPYPDLNIFIDVPINLIEDRLATKRTGIDRDYLNGSDDIHEVDMAFQNRVRDNYLSLKSYLNFYTVLAETLPPEEIFNKYKDLLDAVIFNKNDDV